VLETRALDIYLVDGTYELSRHYYAMPSARDSNGREVAAVRGVLVLVTHRQNRWNADVNVQSLSKTALSKRCAQTPCRFPRDKAVNNWSNLSAGTRFLIVEIRAGRATAARPTRFQLIHAVCSNARMYSMTASLQPSMCIHLP
jgi:hypothetical protein